MISFKKKIVLIIIVITGFAFSNSSAQSILGSGTKIASSEIAKETVESIIESARREASRLMANAENSGNVLITRAADELNLSAENVARLLSKETDKLFEEIEQDKRDILIGLASATNTAKSLGNQAYTLKDTFVLDLRTVLGDIPFVKESLVLQRISGLSLIAGRQTYKIEILGSYIGLPGEDHGSTLSILVDGNKLEGLEVDPKEIHLAELRIPSTSIKEYFQTESAVRVPITLRVQQTFKERLWGFLWEVERTKEYDSKLNLTLYPSYAGLIDIVARHQEYGWKKIETAERSMTHSDHCSSDCDDHYGTIYSVTISETGNTSNPQLGDRRITNASCKRTGGISGYSVHEGTNVSEDKSTATCSIRFRTQPQTYTIYAEREEFAVVDEKDSEQQIKVYFDQISEIRIPKHTSTLFFRGSLITGENLDMLASEISIDAPIEIIRKVENEDDVSVFIRAKRPEGI